MKRGFRQLRHLLFTAGLFAVLAAGLAAAPRPALAGDVCEDKK